MKPPEAAEPPSPAPLLGDGDSVMPSGCTCEGHLESDMATETNNANTTKKIADNGSHGVLVAIFKELTKWECLVFQTITMQYNTDVTVYLVVYHTSESA